MEALDAADSAARRLDPAGEQALLLAKRMRRQALAAAGGRERRRPERVRETAEAHFGLPQASLTFWRESRPQRPWRDRAEVGDSDG